MFFSTSSPQKKEQDEKGERKEEQSEVIRNALGGGGRYDSLVKILGGRDTPATGVAGGVERIIELMKGEAVRLPRETKPQVFFMDFIQLFCITPHFFSNIIQTCAVNNIKIICGINVPR